MRKRNWHQHNKALVQKGSLSFLIDPKCLKQRKPKRCKGPGRLLAFSDPLILMLPMVKIHCKLPYRMLEGFTKNVLSGVELPPTYYSLTCFCYIALFAVRVAKKIFKRTRPASRSASIKSFKLISESSCLFCKTAAITSAFFINLW